MINFLSNVCLETPYKVRRVDILDLDRRTSHIKLNKLIGNVA